MPSRKQRARRSPSPRRDPPRPSATQRASISRNPRGTRRRFSAAQQGGDLVIEGDPYGVLSEIGPRQDPIYRSTGQRQGDGWRGTVPREEQFYQITSFPSTGDGPRDSGRFGILDRSNGYAYRKVDSTDATAAPEYHPDRWEQDRGRGFGELVPSINGGRGYDHRDVPAWYAQAEWQDLPEPHTPGRVGYDARSRGAYSPTGDPGYRERGDTGRYPQPRGYTARERFNMREQFWEPEDPGICGALHWRETMMTPEQRERELRRLVSEEWRALRR